MERVRKMNRAQRVVAVVALAGLLRVVGDSVISQLPVEGGWFGYAPLSAELPFDTGFFRGGWRALLAGFIWIVLIAAWGAASIWLFGQPYGEEAGDRS